MRPRFSSFYSLLLLCFCTPVFSEQVDGIEEEKAFFSLEYTEVTPPETSLLSDSEDLPPIYATHKRVCGEDSESNGYTINFENIRVIELIRFISQISNTNFVFDSKDLKAADGRDLQVSIVSEDPTSVENLMASLLQVLRMHGLSVIEQGNNVLIFRETASVSRVSTIVTDETYKDACNSSVITRVFRLYNISPERVEKIVVPLLSKEAVIEVSTETRHLIVTDITANVDKIAELLTALDTPNAVLDVAEYIVQSSYPAVLASYAKEILAPLAVDNPMQMIPQPSSKKIFIVSTPYLIHKARQILQSLDSADITDVSDLPPFVMANNVFRVYKLKYQRGDQIARAIHAIGQNLQHLGVSNVELVNTIYSLQWLEMNNSLVLSGTQEAVSKVVELIDELDEAPKQVYLEVLIIDTSLSNSLNFGVQWVALGNEQDKLAFASGLLNAPPANAPSGSLGFQQPPLFGGARDAMNGPPPNAARGGQPGTGGDVPLSTGFGFGIMGNIISHNGQNFLTLGALVNALETDADTTIVLNPKIMTEDDQEANFFVGENIPYQTSNTIVRDTGSVTQNIQYEDIGVQLRIIPMIAPNNVVTLQLDQSVSDRLTGVSDLTPTTTKILTSTRVHVPDGTFLVMSGHVRDVERYERSGIPCLGSLPWFGPAFSTTNESREKRNLILFVRPRVVTNIQEGLCLTNQEGYEFNWEADPASIIECGRERAPECEEYPARPLCPPPQPPPPMEDGLYPIPPGYEEGYGLDLRCN